MNIGEFLLEKVFLASSDDDLVVDVGNVLNKCNVVAKIILEDSSADVCRNIISSMTHMRVIIHGWSTTVPGDMIGNQCIEFSFCSS